MENKQKSVLKTRASRRNVRKAQEARKEKAAERRLQKLLESAENVEQAVETAKELVPGVVEEEIQKLFEKTPKKNLARWFRESLYRTYEEAGGPERLRKLAKTDDKIFLKVVENLISILKADPEGKQPTGPAVRVNTIGLNPDGTDTSINVKPVGSTMGGQ